jgi:hypothetical protein
VAKVGLATAKSDVATRLDAKSFMVAMDYAEKKATELFSFGYK